MATAKKHVDEKEVIKTAEVFTAALIEGASYQNFTDKHIAGVVKKAFDISRTFHEYQEEK